MEQRILDTLSKLVGSPPEMFTDIIRDKNELYFRFKGIAFSLLFAPDRPPQNGPYAFYIYPDYDGALGPLAQDFAGGNDPDITVHNYQSALAGEDGARLMQQLWKKLNDIKPTPLDQALRKILED